MCTGVRGWSQSLCEARRWCNLGLIIEHDQRVSGGSKDWRQRAAGPRFEDHLHLNRWAAEPCDINETRIPLACKWLICVTAFRKSSVALISNSLVDHVCMKAPWNFKFACCLMGFRPLLMFAANPSCHAFRCDFRPSWARRSGPPLNASFALEAHGTVADGPQSRTHAWHQQDVGFVV